MAHRIWLKAAYGLDGMNEAAGDPGRCSLLTWPDNALVIPDTLAHPATASSPLVTGRPGVRFYAAALIVTADGHRLGTVNVMDIRPRTITAADLGTLADLTAIVMDELELRRSARRRCAPSSSEPKRSSRPGRPHVHAHHLAAGHLAVAHGYGFASIPLRGRIYMLPLTGGFVIAEPVSGILSDRFGARGPGRPPPCPPS